MDDPEKLPISQTLIPPAPAEATSRTLLTYDELSQRTGISVSTLRRRVQDGSLPFFQPGGVRTRIVFLPDVIERLMQPAAPSLAPKPQPLSTPPRIGPRPKWQRDLKDQKTD